MGKSGNVCFMLWSRKLLGPRPIIIWLMKKRGSINKRLVCMSGPDPLAFPFKQTLFNCSSRFLTSIFSKIGHLKMWKAWKIEFRTYATWKRRARRQLIESRLISPCSTSVRNYNVKKEMISSSQSRPRRGFFESWEFPRSLPLSRFPNNFTNTISPRSFVSS